MKSVLILQPTAILCIDSVTFFFSVAGPSYDQYRAEVRLWDGWRRGFLAKAQNAEERGAVEEALLFLARVSTH